MINIIKKNILALALMLYASSAFSLIELDSHLGTVDGYTRIVLWEWEENKDAPNPCYGAPVCYVTPDVQGHTYRPTLSRNFQEGQYIEAQMYEKAYQVRDAWVRKYPLTTYLAGYFRWKEDLPKCAKMYYTLKTPSANDDVSPREFPGTTCHDLVPGKQVCVFELADHEVQFGQLSLTEINGRKKKIGFSISCLYASNIHIYAMSDTREEEVSLSKDGELYATLSMDGKSLYNGFSTRIDDYFKTRNFNIDVELVLDGYSISSGAYSGNAIIYFVHD